jgi:hypothetical protein
LRGIIAHRFHPAVLLMRNRSCSCYICKTDFLNKVYLKIDMRFTLRQIERVCRRRSPRERFAGCRRPCAVAVGNQHRACRTRTTIRHATFRQVRQDLAPQRTRPGLLPQAVELIERAAAIASVLEGRAGYGQLRIGATLTIGNYLATLIVADFLKRHPESTLQLRCTTRHDHRSSGAPRTRSGTDRRSCRHPDWSSNRGWQTNWWCSVRPGIRWPGQGTATLAELAEQSWIVREPGSGTRETLDQALRHQHFAH